MASFVRLGDQPAGDGSLPPGWGPLERFMVPFDTLFQVSQVPAYAYDPATLRILVANHAAAEFYGYDHDTFLSLTVDRIVAEPHWPVVRDIIANATPFTDVEGVHQHADGRPLPVRVTARAIEVDGRPIRLNQVQDMTEVIFTRAQLQDYLRNVVSTIARTVRARDPYTHRHQERVAELAELIARGMGLSEDDIVGLVVGARIHDIGKVSLPAEILSFPGPLSPEAMELVKGHPQTGYELVADLQFPWPVADMIVQHHERLDGSGYPHGLVGDQALLASRIIAVADVAEAMTAHRPYRPARPLDTALEEIETGSGLKYEPDVATACSRIMRVDGFRLDTPGM
ncbi:MAG: HD domain-containing phosphohydrolase [Actinomycetota bacterium]|nr:HD domain-containing phosphohydrolase [Actinomycetota bacterium]